MTKVAEVKDEMVLIPVPVRHYWLVMEALHKAEHPENQGVLEDKPWTKEEFLRLSGLILNGTSFLSPESRVTIVRLFDMTAANPEGAVRFKEVWTNAGRSFGAARLHFGGLTSLVKSVFHRTNWPVAVKRGKGTMLYQMRAEYAAWWKEARRDSSAETE